jgi:Cof subfamily protein (haloacid dehalogenase superfamily)
MTSLIKLICTDVDGTLLNAERALSEYTLQVFGKLDKNINVVLASSRMPKALWHIQKVLSIEHVPLICYNGALILSEGGHFTPDIVLASQTIPRDDLKSIMDLAVLHQIHISIFQNDTWTASANDHWAQREIKSTGVYPDQFLSDLGRVEINDLIDNGAHKIMLMGDPEKIDILATALKALSVSVWRSKDIYLEITPVNTDKAKGLSVLLNKIVALQKITPSEIMAFGDNYNDMEMIAAVKYGVAVGNSVKDLKNIAYHVTKTNKEDGVAFYLDSFFD